MAGAVGSETLSAARSSRESDYGVMHEIRLISGAIREGRLKVAYPSSTYWGPKPKHGGRRVLYAIDVGRAERSRNLEPNSLVWSNALSEEFQCSKSIRCKFKSGEAEIVLRSKADQYSKVAIRLVKKYTDPLLPWYLEDYMVLTNRDYRELQLKTFAKQPKKQEYPESEQTNSYGTDGEIAGRMATSAKFQIISQHQSAYNHWAGQMRVQLKTFAKKPKKREYPESKQTDRYGTDGEIAGRMANSAKFQSISKDQSAYNHWAGQMEMQLKTFANQPKKRKYPESEQTDSYGTDGEIAGRMATSAKFQSISQDQSAYNPGVQLKTFAKQRKNREYPESKQTDRYGTDGEIAGRMATSAKFQSISQDQSAYNHWAGQMEMQLKPFAKQRKKREHPESEQSDSYGTDGESAGRMATSAKFQSISQDQLAYKLSVQLKTFAKQRKNREGPESEQTDSYGTDGETAGCMATSAKFPSISQDQSAYNHWAGQMPVQLKPFAKQRKKREHPESEQSDSYGTDGEIAGRMATSAKFQSISKDQSAYNHWAGQMEIQLKTFANQPKKPEYPESWQTRVQLKNGPELQKGEEPEPYPDPPPGEEDAKGCLWFIIIWSWITRRAKRSIWFIFNFVWIWITCRAKRKPFNVVHPEPDQRVSEEDANRHLWFILIWVWITRRAKRSIWFIFNFVWIRITCRAKRKEPFKLVHPEPRQDQPDPDPPFCSCCCLVMMLLFVVLALAVALVVWVVRE